MMGFWEWLLNNPVVPEVEPTAAPGPTPVPRTVSLAPGYSGERGRLATTVKPNERIISTRVVSRDHCGCCDITEYVLDSGRVLHHSGNGNHTWLHRDMRTGTMFTLS